MYSYLDFVISIAEFDKKAVAVLGSYYALLAKVTNQA
jgi:hypothetical protein